MTSGRSSPNEEILRARSRVVEHWKRFFAILVGFALTYAVIRTYSCVLNHEWSGVWCFGALVVTLPPVFLGMERSLDLRYLQDNSAIPNVITIAGDTFLLFLTGLAFMALAVSIPDPSQAPWKDHVASLENYFIVIIGVFFLIDAPILLLTGRRLDEGQRRVHILLATIDFLAAILCLATLKVPSLYASRFIVVFAVATVRTIADYGVSGGGFLYPQDSLVRAESNSL
jgi:uncharacterized membrane protein SirB2